MGEVKTGKQQILVDEKEARLGKLQAFANEWEETFGRKMVAFVAETVGVFVVRGEAFAQGLQVVTAVKKAVLVQEE